MDAREQPVWPLTVYYDGACVVCATEMDYYRRQPHAGRLRFVDISQPDFVAGEHGRTLAEFRRRMQARDSQGSFWSGVDAFAAIWRALPGRRYRWLVAVINFPGLHRLACWGYALFARFRHLLPKRRNCEGESCRLPPKKTEPRGKRGSGGETTCGDDG